MKGACDGAATGEARFICERRRHRSDPGLIVGRAGIARWWTSQRLANVTITDVAFSFITFGSWSAAPPLPLLPVRIPHVVPPSRFVPLRSALPAADAPAGRNPFPRVSRARPSARVSAGAVRAPDCACAHAREPDAGRTSPVGRIEGFFPRRRRRGRKRPPDASSHICSLYILVTPHWNASPSTGVFRSFLPEG